MFLFNSSEFVAKVVGCVGPRQSLSSSKVFFSVQLTNNEGLTVEVKAFDSEAYRLQPFIQIDNVSIFKLQ